MKYCTILTIFLGSIVVSPEVHSTDDRILVAERSDLPTSDDHTASSEKKSLKSDNVSRNGLPPALFWASLSVTLAATATWATLEMQGYLMIENYERNNLDNEYFHKAENIQLCSRVFLGLSALSMVSTIVIPFFTDFRLPEERATVAFGVTPVSGGGAFLGTATTF